MNWSPWIPLIVCIVGLLFWQLGKSPETKDAGRIAYAFGLIVFLVECAARIVRL